MAQEWTCAVTSRELATPSHWPRQNAVMALRFAVQADTRQECARGLEELCERLGLQPAMLPRLLTDNRWMARAVPATPKAPAREPTA